MILNASASAGEQALARSKPKSDIPNRATEAEVVNVCRALGHTLVGLSISMCKPELIVPHIPRFVHEIVPWCPLLQSFGLEDMRCSDFDDGHMVSATSSFAHGDMKTAAHVS